MLRLIDMRTPSLLLDGSENCHILFPFFHPGILPRAVVLKNRCEMTATRQQKKKMKEARTRGDGGGKQGGTRE